MNQPADIHFKSATDLAAMIQAGTITSEALLDHYLERVKTYNDALHAIVVFDLENARKDAQAADAAQAQGRCLGPLHGVPMTIKESFNLQGLPTTFGFPEFKDSQADEDALAVQRLKAAGAVIFGKTNVPVGLADFQSYNDIYGTTSNPWDLNRGPGGSSGGSAAALAAGLTGFEVGSDIGGSIRNPAHFCGVFGHKPTFGLLPTRGHSPVKALKPTDLSVIGPLGRSASDLKIGVELMAGPDEIMARGLKLNLPQFNKSLSELKVAVWSNDSRAPVAAEIEERVSLLAEKIRSAGGQVDFDAKPDFDIDQIYDAYQTLLHATMSSRSSEDFYASVKARANALSPDDMTPDAVMLRRRTADVFSYNQALEIQARCRWAWHRFFEEYDAILMPIMSVPAFPHDHGPMNGRTLMIDNEERPYFEQLFWASLGIVGHLPSTVVPTGPGRDGLPIGVQIMGKEYGDLETIGIAQLLEQEGCAFVPPPNYSQ